VGVAYFVKRYFFWPTLNFESNYPYIHVTVKIKEELWAVMAVVDDKGFAKEQMMDSS
jgi:hypothetical protein